MVYLTDHKIIDIPNLEYWASFNMSKSEISYDDAEKYITENKHCLY